MNKTIKQLVQLFVRWLFDGFITVSGLCYLGFWYYAGVAFWTHREHYLVSAAWWLAGTIPSLAWGLYRRAGQRVTKQTVKK
jgi:hypothetical protein